MAIQRPAEMTGLNDEHLNVFNSIIDAICSNAAGITHVSTEPTIKTVPEGHVVLYDNGTDTRRLYMVTAKKKLCYITLTEA